MRGGGRVVVTGAHRHVIMIVIVSIEVVNAVPSYPTLPRQHPLKDVINVEIQTNTISIHLVTAV